MKLYKLQIFLFLVSSSCFAGVENDSKFNFDISSYNYRSANESETFQNTTVRKLELKGWTATAAMISLVTTQLSSIPFIAGATFSIIGKHQQAACFSRIGLATFGAGFLAFSGIYAANVQTKKVEHKYSSESPCEDRDENPWENYTQ
jgi:hypothetical protein